MWQSARSAVFGWRAQYVVLNARATRSHPLARTDVRWCLTVGRTNGRDSRATAGHPGCTVVITRTGELIDCETKRCPTPVSELTGGLPMSLRWRSLAVLDASSNAIVAVDRH